jgi:glycosyltransferase involved in cell wall biosynthesis
MSIWTPVISFSAPWVREIISNEQNSFITNNKKDFFSYTYYIIKNNSLNKKISNSAKNISLKYDIKNFENNLDKIFIELNKG